jgi:predicted RNA-binding Zn-ribbon protein involved in translation (DUF1610 family)
MACAMGAQTACAGEHNSMCGEAQMACGQMGHEQAHGHLLLPSTPMSSPTQVEHILSPPSEDVPMAVTPPQMGRDKPKKLNPAKIKHSVFDILNIFRRRWFLSRANLLTNVISAQKDEDGNISWVEFTPQYHSHLVKCAVALVPHPVIKVKKVMFVYILELLNGKGHLAFFDLQAGGRKANNAQKEKRRLARKRSRASKRERDREAAKAARLPTRQRQCVACGRKFESRKTAKKHKCPKAKVERVRREAASGQASQATPIAKIDKPPATLTHHAPPTTPARSNPSASSNNDGTPMVTGDSWDPDPPNFLVSRIDTGVRHRITRKDWEEKYAPTGLWKLGPGIIPPGLH